MEMVFAGTAHSAIKRAAHNAGLALTAGQVRDIAQAEGACLAEGGRVLFGQGAVVRLIREFATSPFVASGDAAQTLIDLTRAFYALRQDYPSTITDAQIIESLQEPFEGEAAGDADLAMVLARESLANRAGCPVYEIANDSGNVYRWDPENWRGDPITDSWHDDSADDGWSEDLTASGWYGERWEDVDE